MRTHMIKGHLHVNWPPKPFEEYANPDSDYWHKRAIAKAELLVERIGYDAYDAWVDSLPEFNWRLFFNLVNEKLEGLHGSTPENMG